MIGTIRRHSKVLWVVIITVVIISFVIYFNPGANRGGGGGGTENFGMLNGVPIRKADYIGARREAELYFWLNNRRWPGQEGAGREMNFDGDIEARQRLLLIAKMEELNVKVGDDALIAHLQTFFRDPATGKFSAVQYDNFVKSVLPQGGLTEKDLERFFRHQLGIQQLNQVVSLSGKFVTSRAAEAAYRQENEQLATEAVLFASSNYLASVKVKPEDLGKYFTNNMPSYRLPERVQVSYVAFPLTNYLADADAQMAKITGLEADVEKLYKSSPTNSFKDDADNMLSPTAAKAKIKDGMRRGRALQVARKAANEFANDLFNEEKRTPASFLKLAAAKSFPVKETELFAERTGPKLPDAPEKFAELAFKLSAEEPITPPVVGEETVYVLALKEKLPSAPQPLEAVLAKVTEDYRQFESGDLARKAGRAFYATLTNGLAAGKAFKALCLENKLKLVEPPAFSASARAVPELEEAGINLLQIRRPLTQLAPGKTTTFIPTREGGYILYLRSRLPVAEEKIKSDLPGYLEELREGRQNTAFNAWFRKEFEPTLKELELSRQAVAAAKKPKK